ncbi:MAG: WecB/TagA/CpsF family glycosyltransferase [Syntrophales bacterium LBB04]|nr:WecB/TagA/CpsF family glycosyltransferase [Syntrophales bacterium LBB04]
MRENILGYNVNTLSVDECADELFQSLKDGKSIWLACFNPHSYAMALQDETFTRALKSADVLIPDGTGIVLASRLLGGTIKARVTGSDVFAGLHKRMNAAGGMSVFFLGSTEETLLLMRQRMARDYPNVQVAGTYSPPFTAEFSDADNNMMIEAINKARPDVLWVGMTAPKQEKFIFENRLRLEVNFAAAVGGVFDFFAGTIRRNVGSWFLSHGLEWLPRLMQEPRRLWKRTFVSAPLFLLHVLKQRFKIKD